MNKSYFTTDFLSFFQELTENNHKAWFEENRKRYEKEIKKPFKAFVEDLILRAQQFDQDLVTDTKESIFRINRDIRFSKDKTPYKTRVSAALANGGRKSHLPGYYVELGATGIMVGGGSYFLGKEHLYKVRMEIAYEGDEFKKLIEGADFKKVYKEVLGDKNKILPSEFKDTLPHQPLVANKQFYYMAKLPATLITSPNLLEELAKCFEAGFPLNQFITRALKD